MKNSRLEQHRLLYRQISPRYGYLDEYNRVREGVFSFQGHGELSFYLEGEDFPTPADAISHYRKMNKSIGVVIFSVGQAESTGLVVEETPNEFQGHVSAWLPDEINNRDNRKKVGKFLMREGKLYLEQPDGSFEMFDAFEEDDEEKDEMENEEENEDEGF